MFGDWDGDGVDTVGVNRDGEWLLRNTNGSDFAQIDFFYGDAFDGLLTGDWDGDGMDTVGVVRQPLMTPGE